MKINIVKDNKLINNINDEFVLYNSNVIKDKLDIAINLVKEYILKNELLIVGGTAIDYALRLNNMELYDLNYNIQDFDIISPKNIDHANNIGIILCNKGFNNISIIPAIHNTTVRVQYLGYTVFDSTYVPEYIYNNIPYLIYNNYKIIDPNFQKINQYLSVSFLFNITGPNYNIFNRFKKDIERFNMLDYLYQIKLENKLENKLKNKLENVNNNLIEKNINIPKSLLDNIIVNMNNNFSTFYSDICFHGELAYSILYKEFEKILNELLKISKDIILDLQIQKYLDNISIKSNYKIIQSDEYENCYKIKFQIPNITIHSLSIINNNNNIENIYNELKKYNNISDYTKYIGELDIIPKHYNFKNNNLKENLECYIYDLYGEIPSINSLEYLINDENKNKEEIKQNPIKLIISNYNYILAYFLYNYYKTKSITYLNYYYSLYSIIKIINIIKEKKILKNLEENKKFELFDFSIITLNDINLSSNDYNFFKNFSYLVKNNKNLDILPPKNYMESLNCEIKKKYNYNSTYYNTNYIEINETNYKNEIEKLMKN